LRQRWRLSAYAWTDPALTAGQTAISAAHVLEMRSALQAAYSAAGRPPPSYTDPALSAGQTVVRVVHIAELRSAVVALEQ
jgi:hypothetical protein